ncbi:hypothetical protein QUF56_09185 [Ureibacillus composti]|nr:hypothetical protein [Ureibacillus composti]
MKQKDSKIEKSLVFFEDYFITASITLLALFLGINHFLIINSNPIGIPFIDTYFVDKFKNLLTSEDGTLISIASIFIGIYFTVFTLFSNIKVDSTFSILEQENFEKLLKYIRNAFIGAFIYLVFALFTSVDPKNPDFTLLVLTLILLLYMLLSALRFGIVIYIIFNTDIKKYYELIELEKVKQKERDQLFIRLKNFLDSEEKKRWEDYHKNIASKFDKEKDG